MLVTRSHAKERHVLTKNNDATYLDKRCAPLGGVFLKNFRVYQKTQTANSGHTNPTAQQGQDLCLALRLGAPTKQHATEDEHQSSVLAGLSQHHISTSPYVSQHVDASKTVELSLFKPMLENTRESVS